MTDTATISITNEIINRMEIRAVKTDSSNAVLVEDINSSFKAWMDVRVNKGEVEVDWNRYIFYCDNTTDLLLKELQDDCNVFDLCSSAALDYLETKGILVYKDGAAFIIEK